MVSKKHFVLTLLISLLFIAITIAQLTQEEINIAVRMRAYDEGWNQGNIDVVDEIYSDDFAGNMPPFDTKEGIKMGLAAYISAIPDVHVEVEDVIAEGEYVALRYTFTGTQEGELMGIPPTGNFACTPGISIAQIVDGKIVAVWENNEMMGMMEQLGVFPATKETYTWGDPSPITGDPGDPETNKAISRKAINQVWMHGNTGVVDELYHPDHLRHDPASPGIDSAEAFKVMIEGFHAAFSDLEFVVDKQVAAGDKVVNYTLLSGKQVADYGGIPSLGNEVSTVIISIHRIADGKIAESWVARDMLGVVEQLTTPPPPPDPNMEGMIADSIYSPSLEGNLLGDPAERDMIIYLPPSYETSNKRYPVVYLLHGYGDTEKQYISKGDPVWDIIEAIGLGEPPDFPENGFAGMMDELIAQGKISEMIVVTPNADNAYGGSLYNNSELTGNYEDYIVQDLVNYMDSNYRTIPDRNSRAIAGQSAGGYGCMKLALRYPDVFGAVASLSGILHGQFFADLIPAVVAENPDGMTGPSEEKVYTNIFYAASAAFAPNLDNPPFYVDMPFLYPSTDINEEVWNKYLEADVVSIMLNNPDKAASLNGIYMDAGDIDEYGAHIYTKNFHEALNAAGIDHEYEEFAGGHRNRLFERMRIAFAYLSGHLATDVSGDTSNVFFTTLNPGLNMISLPLQPTTPYNAMTFAETLSATVVIRYDEVKKKFVGYTAGLLHNNFLIEGGKGYIVNVPEGGTYAFTGAAWTNEPPVNAAPTMPHEAWAFVISGNVKGNKLAYSYTVVTRNLRTGEMATDAVDYNGYFTTAYADLSRNPVVRSGDFVEITVMGSNGSIVSGPQVHEITPESIRDAVVKINMKLGQIIPDRSLLLQNYPNPFNPETWIPYQLNENAHVSLNIYNSSGKLVRSMDLGLKNAGIYTDRSKAIYWNGKNQTGEEAASGIYFYCLKAGDFTSIRKMTVKK
ncbi:T9SS type A sorting domain-containing protein [Candidatus Poribacteria bacterium]|nr:T9SS type A sorting domain-containing protein [Candidatus Poribacteria bacterium]